MPFAMSSQHGAAVAAWRKAGMKACDALPLALLLAFSFGLLFPAPAFAYTVYVTNEKGNSISVIDSDTQKVTQTVPAGRRPRGVTISPDGKLLYVCASDENSVEVFDTATMTMLNAGFRPRPRAIRAQSRWRYALHRQ